jgi:hypothetical protein
MRNAMKFVLCLAASAFAAMPMYGQHGGGHAGGAGGPGASMGSAHSSAADSHSSAADNHSSSASDNHSGAKTPDQLLAQNTKLSSKLQSLLPAGTNVQQAAQGFKNLGQFVAAVHVSHNLGIPFDQLKAKMIGPPTESLGKAIHALKPDTNSTEESKKGEKQAKQDIDDTKVS